MAISMPSRTPLMQVLQRKVAASGKATTAAASGAPLERVLSVARALIGVTIAFSCGLSALLFTLAIRGVRPDFKLCSGAAGSTVAQNAPGGVGEGEAEHKGHVELPRRRLVGFIVGILVLGAAVLFILTLSLIACYKPELFGPGAAPTVVATGDVS